MTGCQKDDKPCLTSPSALQMVKEEPRVAQKQPTSMIVATGLAFEARIIARTSAEVVCSPCATLLAAALERALEKTAQSGAKSCGILSFGTCGGLKPQLEAGAIIIADTVIDGARCFVTDGEWSATLAVNLSNVHHGALASVAAPVTGTHEKAALHRATGALAVDMESRVAAAFAAEHRLPFAVCRVIIDPASRALPPIAIVSVRTDGSIALGPLLWRLITDPSQLIGLIRLISDARAARASLITVRRSLAASLDGCGR